MYMNVLFLFYSLFLKKNEFNSPFFPPFIVGKNCQYFFIITPFLYFPAFSFYFFFFFF